MTEYLKFWLAQAIVEFAIAFTIIGVFLAVMIGLVWIQERKRK
jgi:hypothetical protein